MTTCTIGDCEKPSRTRSWCNMHYQRWLKHGDPLGGSERFATPEEAFLARTEPLLWSGCIIWTGALDRGGYGMLHANGRTVPTHRYAWEQINGPIPAGMVIDHTCWERSCVNTDHLRLATRAQNNSNLSGVRKNGAGLPRGVYRHGRGYSAQVRHNGAPHYLGTFETVEEASAAAQAKRAILFGAFAGGA